MGILSWFSGLSGSKERSSDFLETNEKKLKVITNPPRWTYDFIPNSVTKHLRNNSCMNVKLVLNQITNYEKDQEVGNSVMLQFDFNIPPKFEEGVRVSNVNDELSVILKAIKLEDKVTVKVLQSINWYNVSKKRKYEIRINPISFQVECFFDKQAKTKGCKYQLTFRIFYNP